MPYDEYFNIKKQSGKTVLKIKENSTNVFNMKGQKNDVINTYMLKMGLDVDEIQKLLPTKKHGRKHSNKYW